MFGHQDDTPQTQDTSVSEQPAATEIAPPASDTITPTTANPFASSAPTDPVQPAADSGSTPPLLEEHEQDGIVTPPAATPVAPSTNANSDVPTAAAGDLLDIKQQALQQLSPLVGHLEQSPEEKFRTTMMMIQASDNQSLIGTAYEAANKISDDKARAQALLDIINEINYFTQH